MRNGIELPADSSAAIVSSGLLGGKYLSLVPGGDDRMLTDGGEITLTQSSVNLEDLIGRYIFGGQSGQSGEAQRGRNGRHAVIRSFAWPGRVLALGRGGGARGRAGAGRIWWRCCEALDKITARTTDLRAADGRRRWRSARCASPPGRA